MERWHGLALTTQDTQDAATNTLVPEISLQVCCDASEKGYGACVCLVSIKGDIITSTLPSSKWKVAAIKPSTLPRLEVLAKHTGAKLATAVKGALSKSKHTLSKSRRIPLDGTHLFPTVSLKFSQCCQQLNFFTCRQKRTQQICDHADCYQRSSWLNRSSGSKDPRGWDHFFLTNLRLSSQGRKHAKKSNL